MNRHGDHVATCLCCKNLFFRHEVYSTLSGDCMELGCKKGHWGTDPFYMQDYPSEVKCGLAATCKDFDGKKVES